MSVSIIDHSTTYVLSTFYRNMSPPPLTPEEKAISQAKRKAYQKEYHKTMPVEVKRKYQRALDPIKTKARQDRIRAKRKALSWKTNIPLYKIAT